jgi:hypothetical protein
MGEQRRELDHASASRRDSWTGRPDSAAEVADITGCMKPNPACAHLYNTSSRRAAKLRATTSKCWGMRQRS